MADLDTLYAEWKVYDEQREAAKAASPAPETPRKLTGGDGGVSLGSLPEFIETAPRASHESVERTCRRCQREAEPTIPGPSGKRYVTRQTKAGNTYGLGRSSVLLMYGHHAIERRRPGWNLEGMVDRLTPILRTRAEAVAEVRAMVPATEWPKLDALLVRWFRFPGTWRGARERIERCIRYMNLSDVAERQAMKALNTMALRGTWAT